GRTNIVRLLLEHHADINAQTTNGYSALSQAARYGKKGVVEILLEWKPNIELEDDSGKTALGWALQNDSGRAYAEIAWLLREHGATKETSNIRRTSIHEAAGTGDWERVKKLLEEKPALAADKDSIFGETALHEAAGAGKAEICKFLLEKNADA